MNKFEVQGSGFPGTNQTWRFLRDMINDVHHLTAIGGDTYILKGCINTAGIVSDGFVVYQGELIPFQGGAIGTQVTIIETVEKVTYLEDIAPADGVGDDKDAYFTRYAKFGSNGVVTFDWSELVRINPVIELQKSRVHVGMMMIWPHDLDDATHPLPEGWQVCNGTNGTPALAGMTLVQVDPNDVTLDAVGKQVGSKTHTLTTSQMPQHTHSGNVVIPPHKHQLPKTVYSKEGGSGDDNTFTYKNNSGKTDVTETLNSPSQSVNLTTSSKGSGQPHNNMQPSFAVNYIMYVG